MNEVRALLELLAIPSPSGEEGEALSAFAEQAADLGFRVERDAVGNALASLGRGRPHVMFLGHIDTVPGHWPVEMRGGRIHGRGAVDAKGPLLAGLFAASRVGDEGPGTRSVVAAVGEETDSRGIREILKGPPPDALVVGEPSRWDRVTIGYQGQRTGSGRFVTEARHPSSPEPGALDLAVAVAARVRSVLGEPLTSPQGAGASARIVGWAYASDGLRDSAEFRIDVRAGVGFDWGSLERGFPELRWSPPVEAVVVDKGNPVVRALVAAIREEGGSPAYLLKKGTSDMNHAAGMWRIPMGSYGPGDGTLGHSPEERLSVDEYLTSIRVLERTFRLLRGISQPRGRSGEP